MDLQMWCAARRGFPVVAVDQGIIYFGDGRRWDQERSFGDFIFKPFWLDPLPGTEAAHDWTFQQQLDHPTVEAP